MGILDIFKEKEAPTPAKIVELAVFSLGSEADLYKLSQHLSVALGTSAWERFVRRRSLVFVLDEGKLAAEIPYKMTVRLFEDGGGVVKLDLDLSGKSFDIEEGVLWRRRELSAALTRFMEAALSTHDPEGIKHTPGAGAGLLRLGIVPERIAGELDFGFTPGSTVIKIGILPKKGEKLAGNPDLVSQDGILYLEKNDEDKIAELERWFYREGAAAWHRLSLRRWLERMDDVRSSASQVHAQDFARFLRRVNYFILRERRFRSAWLPVPYLEQSAEFTLLTADFDPTSRRLSDIFSARAEEVVTATVEELRRLSLKQEKLFAGWVVLIVVAAIFLGLYPGATWQWIVGAAGMIVLSLGAYFLWGLIRRRPGKDARTDVKLSELDRRRRDIEQVLSTLEGDEKVPDDFRDELVTRKRRELARLARLRAEESRPNTDSKRTPESEGEKKGLIHPERDSDNE